MPAIQSITIGSNVLQTKVGGTASALNALIIPSTSVPVVENWLNTTYLPSLHDGSIQMIAHVFSTNPLMIALWTADPGVALPANWWVAA